MPQVIASFYIEPILDLCQYQVFLVGVTEPGVRSMGEWPPEARSGFRNTAKLNLEAD